VISRRWLERGLIVVAALATIATSKRKWHLDASVPTNDPATARLVVIASSAQPDLGMNRPLEAAPQWPGEARYLISAGATLDRVGIYGSGGCEHCGGECVPPDTAFVRVVSITPVATWKLEVKSDPQTITLPPTGDRFVQRRVAVRASHPTRSRVVTSMHEPSASDYDNAVTLTWPHIEQEVTLTWTLHTMIEGPCPDLRPCEPPSDASVSIGAVAEVND
jgi:hypothetical protein